MNLLPRIVRRLTGELAPPLPFPAELYFTTTACSVHDEPHQPSSRLIQLTLQAAREAEHLSLAALAARPAIRQSPQAQNLTLWPGEHYKLLASLVRLLQPNTIVEIGTHRGWSALAMKQEMPAGARLSTFDITPWDAFAETGLVQKDFADGRLVQHIADLADWRVAQEHRDLLASADLIFMDGPHDGPTEYKMMENFAKIDLRNNPLLVFDDIKMPALLKFWRDLPLPKMDVTSFGHWSGTGLAEWNPSASDACKAAFGPAKGAA